MAIPYHALQRKPAHPSGPSAVIQKVKAYRVDRDAANPKVVVTGGRVTDFQADDGFGINISFVDSSHADYYLEKHGGILTEFEIEDDLWAAIQTRRDKRKTGNEEYDKLTVTACTDPKVPNKENALYLANGWITYLKKNVKGRATVYRPAEDTSKLKSTDMVWAYTEEDGVADHENAVELSLSEAEAGGWQVMTIAEAKRRGFWHE